jgi:hypothetical protein
MKKIFLAVLIACSIASCSDPKDKIIPPDSSKPAAEQPKKEAAPTAQAVMEGARPGKREALRKQVDDLLTVTVLELRVEKGGIEPGNLFDQLLIKLGFQNKGSKDIKSITGEVKFMDRSDKEVGSYHFSYDEGVEAGKKATWIHSRHDKEFMQSHKALTRLEEGKYKTRFEPELIVFADGSKLIIKD